MLFFFDSPSSDVSHARTAVSVGVAVFSQRNLDVLDLLGHGRQHALLQTVELVEAAPGAHLTQTHKDAAHRLKHNTTKPCD